MGSCVVCRCGAQKLAPTGVNKYNLSTVNSVNVLRLIVHYHLQFGFMLIPLPPEHNANCGSFFVAPVTADAKGSPCRSLTTGRADGAHRDRVDPGAPLTLSLLLPPSPSGAAQPPGARSRSSRARRALGLSSALGVPDQRHRDPGSARPLPPPNPPPSSPAPLHHPRRERARERRSPLRPFILPLRTFFLPRFFCASRSQWARRSLRAAPAASSWSVGRAESPEARRSGAGEVEGIEDGGARARHQDHCPTCVLHSRCFHSLHSRLAKGPGPRGPHPAPRASPF